METVSHQPLARNTASVHANSWSDPAYQAFTMLRVGFTVLPIVFGLDKFFDVLTDWENYLAGWINNVAPGSGREFMLAVGVIEIVAGIAVAVRQRDGALLVAAWLAGIIVNLVTIPGFYDVALRDLGLSRITSLPPGR